MKENVKMKYEIKRLVDHKGNMGIKEEDRGFIAKESDKIRKLYIGAVSRLSPMSNLPSYAQPQISQEQGVSSNMVELKIDGETLQLKKTPTNIKLLIMALKEKLKEETNEELDEDIEKKMEDIIAS